MLKSKKFTVGIVVLILLFEISTTLTSLKAHKLFYSIINPSFWVLLAILVFISLKKGVYVKHKWKKEILQSTLIIVLIYIIIYLLVGLVVSFGKNPYAVGLKAFIYNMITLGTVIIAKEYLRYKLISNVYEKDKIKIATIISIIFVIIDFNFYIFFRSSRSTYFIYQEFSQKLLPSVVKNILFSYLAMNAGCLPAIMYELLIKIYFLSSPIIAKTPWILNSIIDILTPFVLYLYIRYLLSKKDIFKIKSRVVEFNPKEIFVLISVVTITVLFTIGFLPIKPLTILTGSMEPNIYIGDIVVIKKCSPKKIEVNDIIEYQVRNNSIIHRVIDIKEQDGKLSFVTKGDNNNKIDSNIVKESQIIGKVIYRVKYLGYPAVWMYSLQHVSREISYELTD